MFINWKLREMNLKVVYYGPAMSGKTTNLQRIHEKTSPKIRGELISLKTRGDRTLYFDFLQIELGRVAGLKPRFNLYTVPGQSYYVSSRRLVLQGADGVVFVADSDPGRMSDNIQSVQDLVKNLNTLGINPQAIPIILQCNKRDLPDAMPVADMQKRLGFSRVPCYAATATNGEGIFETMKAAISMVVKQAQKGL